MAILEDGSFIFPLVSGETRSLDEHGRFVDYIKRINESGMSFTYEPGPSIEWQRTMTPAVVLDSADARGCVHQSITDLLGGSPEKYFFRNNMGKVFLVKHHLHAPPDVGAHHEVRVKMAAAVAAWHTLSESEKESWKRHKEGKWRGLPGYQLFISFKMRGLM